jgi:hypothetical protein
MTCLSGDERITTIKCVTLICKIFDTLKIQYKSTNNMLLEIYEYLKRQPGYTSDYFIMILAMVATCNNKTFAINTFNFNKEIASIARRMGFIFMRKVEMDPEDFDVTI